MSTQKEQNIMTPSLGESQELTAVESTAVRDLLGRMGAQAPVEEIVAELARAGVDVTEEQVAAIRAQLSGGASETAPSRNAAQVQGARPWHEHEAGSESANVQAQSLISEAGSPDLAKQAIDAVAARSRQGSKADPRDPARMANPGGQNRKDELAGRLGFQSYLEMFEASTPVPTQDGKAWCVTSAPGGDWIVWNDADLTVYRREATKASALAAVPHHG